MTSPCLIFAKKIKVKVIVNPFYFSPVTVFDIIKLNWSVRSLQSIDVLLTTTLNGLRAIINSTLLGVLQVNWLRCL